MSLRILKNIVWLLFGKKRLSRKIRKCNEIQINKSALKNISFNIRGCNNTVVIKNNTINGKIFLNIFGDNNRIFIDENVSISDSLRIYIGQDHPYFGKVTDSVFSIGKNTSVESLKYITYNSGTFCEIGDDCMISFGITIYNTDGHPILDKETGKLVNHVSGIRIGRHSWLGMNTVILKNSVIPDNSIIGCSSVFSGKKFTRTYCAYAGNPAVQIRTDVDWNVDGKRYGYITNNRQSENSNQ